MGTLLYTLKTAVEEGARVGRAEKVENGVLLLRATSTHATWSPRLCRKEVKHCSSARPACSRRGARLSNEGTAQLGRPHVGKFFNSRTTRPAAVSGPVIRR